MHVLWVNKVPVPIQASELSGIMASPGQLGPAACKAGLPKRLGKANNHSTEGTQTCWTSRLTKASQAHRKESVPISACNSVTLTPWSLKMKSGRLRVKDGESRAACPGQSLKSHRDQRLSSLEKLLQ